MNRPTHAAFCRLAVAVACTAGTALPADLHDELRARALKHFTPLPAKMPGAENDSRALRRLGRKLYFDKGLSAKGDVSCHTCHALENDGNGYEQAGIPDSLVKPDDRNSPTVLNAGLQFTQFWDGRAPDLKEQAKVPMLNPEEMGMADPEQMLERLRNSWSYRWRFRRAFPKEAARITLDRVAHAIAAHERTLITRDRFDDFLEGDDRSLHRRERQGLRVFLDAGCPRCHDGRLLGGNTFKKMGVYHPYPNTNDLGRERVTGDANDRFRFKVPPLRNVALTAPYFHDGKVKTLDEAVRQMAHLQLDKRLSEEEVNAIVAFLKTLSDKKLLVKTPTVPPRALEHAER